MTPSLAPVCLQQIQHITVTYVDAIAPSGVALNCCMQHTTSERLMWMWHARDLHARARSGVGGGGSGRPEITRTCHTHAHTHLLL